MTGTTAGVKNNTTSAVTSNEGGNGNTASASITVGKIQHVVVIFQENRSTDNMFQDPVLSAAAPTLPKAEKTRMAILSRYNWISLRISIRPTVTMHST